MPCPICNKPSVAEFKPFCCQRCADVDLNRWFKGAYTTPVVEMDDVDIPDEGEENYKE